MDFWELCCSKPSIMSIEWVQTSIRDSVRMLVSESGEPLYFAAWQVWAVEDAGGGGLS